MRGLWDELGAGGGAAGRSLEEFRAPAETTVVKVVRWFAEPVLVVGSFLVTLGVIALLNGGSFRAAATLSGEGEPIAERAEANPSAGALAGTPASTLAFVRRVTGDEQPILRRSAHKESDQRSGAGASKEAEPALGIIFDDAWLLLIAGGGVLCIGKGLRLVTEPAKPARAGAPSLRSA